jgi:hypothetical protein
MDQVAFAGGLTGFKVVGGGGGFRDGIGGHYEAFFGFDDGDGDDNFMYGNDGGIAVAMTAVMAAFVAVNGGGSSDI